MKKLSILVAAVLATQLFAQEPPKVQGADNKPSVGLHQEKEAMVTFHVIGMKKTASGAT